MVEDLVCFSDFFPTMVEAAGLPSREIRNGDGWSFWPQCNGEAGRKRDWIYCYYFPRPAATRYNDKYNHYETRFARDFRYKLYEDGRLFDTTNDVLERSPITIGNAGSVGESTRGTLQDVLDSYPRAGLQVKRKK